MRLFTGKRDSPWAWEVFGTYKTQRYAKHFFQPTQNKFYSFNGAQGGAIYRGKWVAEVIDEKIKKYNISLDPNIRGYTDSLSNENRAFSWKLNFIVNGFKTDRLKAFWFLFFYLRNKINY